MENAPSANRLRRFAWWGLASLLHAPLAFRFWFVLDDAYISFRFAKHWAQGHGLRFNLAGPPVEGFSNFLWTALAALIEWLRLEPMFWMPLISYVCALTLLWLVQRVALDELGFSATISGLSIVTLAVFPPFAVWSTSGLETMPFCLALFATFRAMVLVERVPLFSTIAWSSCLFLLRTEGIAWLVVILLIAFSRRRLLGLSQESLWRASWVLLLLFLMYTGGRWSYFGRWLPAPAEAKVAFSDAVFVRGLRYVLTYFLAFWTPLFAFAVIWSLRGKRLSHPLWPVSLLGAGFFAYSALVGGDWMAMGRFLVPAAAFQALWLGAMLESVSERVPLLGRRRALLYVASLAWAFIAVLPAFGTYLAPESWRRSAYFMYSHPGYRDETLRWSQHAQGPALDRAFASSLSRMTEPGDTLVIGAIGAVGYFSELHILDRYGLVEPSVLERCKTIRDAPLRSPGHDCKVSRDFFLDLHPTVLAYDIVGARDLRQRVLAQAKEWEALGSLRRRYVADFAPIGEVPLDEADQLLMILRAIPEDPEESDLKRKERRELRANRATKAWKEFYRRAGKLRTEDSR